MLKHNYDLPSEFKNPLSQCYADLYLQSGIHFLVTASTRFRKLSFFSQLDWWKDILQKMVYSNSESDQRNDKNTWEEFESKYFMKYETEKKQYL